MSKRTLDKYREAWSEVKSIFPDVPDSKLYEYMDIIRTLRTGRSGLDRKDLLLTIIYVDRLNKEQNIFPEEIHPHTKLRLREFLSLAKKVMVAGGYERYLPSLEEYVDFAMGGFGMKKEEKEQFLKRCTDLINQGFSIRMSVALVLHQYYNVGQREIWEVLKVSIKPNNHEESKTLESSLSSQ